MHKNNLYCTFFLFEKFSAKSKGVKLQTTSIHSTILNNKMIALTNTAVQQLFVVLKTTVGCQFDLTS